MAAKSESASTTSGPGQSNVAEPTEEVAASAPEVPAAVEPPVDDAPSTLDEAEPATLAAEETGQAVYPARVSLTTVQLAVRHRQRGTGITEMQQAMIANGAKHVVAEGFPDDTTIDAINYLKKKWHMEQDGEADEPFLVRLGLDVTD